MTVYKPKEHQANGINDVIEYWNGGAETVLLVAPTGAGKTFIKAFMAEIFSNRGELVVIFAHRDVLLSQISMTLAKIQLPHKFICSKATEREISNLHVEEFGYTYRSDDANVIVASVLTWINRDTSFIAPLISAWMMDEAHHLTLGTSWHQCIEPLTNAKGMGVTATPLRADKKGLGRKSGGVFDEMVQTPNMGVLIERGILSKYRIYTVPSLKLEDLEGVNVTSGGDYNQKKLTAATEEADIVGDAVEHYKRLAYGKQGLVFCPSIGYAKEVAKNFNDAGIRAVCLSSKSKLAFRQQKEKEFKRGLIDILVNVDLFGEGYDVPACTVVIMLRKTMSYGLFKQQFGRMLRVFEGKEYGILLDHVGNVAEHCIYGAPHDDPEWSLAPIKKKKKNGLDKGVNTRTCPKCYGFYVPKHATPAHYICPFCGHAENEDEINEAQRELQIREGTLVEYDNSYLTGILAERDKVDVPIERIRQQQDNMYGRPDKVKFAVAKNHLKRQEAQRALRVWVQKWCAKTGSHKQLDKETTQTEFARIFGVDVFKSQVLGERLANELVAKIKTDWSEQYFVKPVLPLKSL